MKPEKSSEKAVIELTDEQRRALAEILGEDAERLRKVAAWKVDGNFVVAPMPN